MTDSTAGGEIPPVEVTFTPGKAIGENNPVRPGVGTIIRYFPSHNEFAGGYAPLPAIVVSNDVLAVIDLSASMVARPMPIGRDTWLAAGSDHAFAHWEEFVQA